MEAAMSELPKYKGDVTLSLSVTDLESAITWYQEVLGFKLLYKVADFGWCEMQSPVANVSVGLGQSEESKPKGGCVPVWGVPDIDQARAALEAHQVRFDGDTRTIPDMVRLATFYDPDGNAWMLAQSLQQG
jgi:predicted enzyme related to lactoylglutathione lyase